MRAADRWAYRVEAGVLVMARLHLNYKVLLALVHGLISLLFAGTTMRAAGLEIVEPIMETEAILITNPCSHHKDMLETLKKRIEGYLTATKYSVSAFSLSLCLPVSPAPA